MKDTEKVLKEELSQHFGGQNQRLVMMSKLIIALIMMCSVNYSKLSIVLNPNSKSSSNFKRIQRFIKQYSFSKKGYIQFVWSLFCNNEKWIALTIDRTNWKFGKCNINILMIGISYKGTAIPLIWMLLDKRGNSSQDERINLFKSLLSLLEKDQVDKIRCLLADREFIGKQWIKYLKNQPFHFFIRIKKNALISKLKGEQSSHVYRLFKQSKFQAFNNRRWIYSHQLFIGGQKINSKEWLIIISDIRLTHGRQFYKERWGIEVFFGACKSRGFNFEDTHVTHLKRLSNLIFIIGIAFCWALKKGEWLVDNGHQIPIKYLKTRKAKLYSLFRFGLNYLKERFLNSKASYEDIIVLSCT